MCKYCGNLYSGDACDSVTHKSKVNFGYIQDAELVSDLMIVENYDVGDSELDGNDPILVFSSWICARDREMDIIREQFPINFCPFCGADLNKVREIAKEE